MLFRSAAIFDVIAGVTTAHAWETIEKVYPNPVMDVLTVKLAPANESFCMISIFSVVGTLVLQFEMPDPDPETQLDVSALPSGMYYLEAKSGSKTFRTKFIKEAKH